MAEREREAVGLESVLDKIWRLRGFDFRSYKRATLKRRIDRRMAELKCSGHAAYLDKLDRDPAEVDRLISSMLIKLTSFFRDPELWEILKTQLLPELLELRRSRQELRIWSAGCATGEEAYSVAFLLADLLGLEALGQQVKIFGTDVDEAAIAFARRGVFAEQQVEGLSADELARWFVRGPGGYAVRKEIRRSVVFGVNNLTSDAPVSRLDLILCRNVFIYLNSELQKRVLNRFQFALRLQGALVLGKSELIPLAAKIFRPVDVAHRIYRRDQAAELVVVPLQSALPDGPVDAAHPAQITPREVLDAQPCPVFTTAVDGRVTLWNRAAARFWGENETEVVGKSIFALALPGLRGEALLEKSNLVREQKSEREWIDGKFSRAENAPELQLRAQIQPLHTGNNELRGLIYVVHDVTPLRALEADLQRVNEELRQAYERAASANDELRASNEELETTNEELQSANEELQTTNEELQSTNEELETTNEELQSTNAELDATNRELEHRSREMDLLMLYQRTIIRGLSAAVVVLDPNGRVSGWNLAAERLLGLTEREATGQVLWSLHVPALKRSLVNRLKLAFTERQPLRLEAAPYQLANGGHGYAMLALTPLLENDQVLGSLLLLEDVTRAISLAKENRELKGKTGRR